MEIKIGDCVRAETEVPILYVGEFCFSWKINCHAVLQLEAYLNREIEWNPKKYDYSRIKIWLDCSGKSKVIFNGYIERIITESIGETLKVQLVALSASCLLARKFESRSFQNPAKTYGEIIKEVVQEQGGQVIRNKESDKEIEVPVIRNDETVWQFAKRMGNRSGNCIIPDVETGRPNIWFGMKNGEENLSFQEDDYVINLTSIGGKSEISFQAESREFYKIGDRTTLYDKKVTIVNVKGVYKKGELVFTYVLGNRTVYLPSLERKNHQAGQGFWGTIKAIKEESVQIALDIDHGDDAGSYFFPWYPESGNVFYAMPEVGARALLYFFRAGEQGGGVLHCVNKEQKEQRDYKNRALDIKGGNEIKLSKDSVSFSKKKDHTVLVHANDVLAKTSKELKIVAEGKIRLSAKQITINTPDELNLCQE